MIATIISPSDPYTLVTEDFTAAAVGVAILGMGKLGLQGPGPEDRTPVLFGWDEWFAERGITDLGEYMREHVKDIAEALDSVRIGHPKDREALDRLLEHVPETTRERARAEWQDRHRTSLNDIGSVAWALAKELREKCGDRTAGQAVPRA